MKAKMPIDDKLIIDLIGINIRNLGWTVELTEDWSNCYTCDTFDRKK